MAKLHHQTWDRSRNRVKILSLLETHGKMRYRDLKEKMNVSNPTLSDYIKFWEEQGKIEHFWGTRDRREKWYRIKPKNKEKVEGQLRKFEVIKFVEGISNPVYVFEQSNDGTTAIGVFTSVIGTEKDRQKAKEAIRKILPLSVKFFKHYKLKHKLAVVLMKKAKTT